jgi:hypothetical protein
MTPRPAHWLFGPRPRWWHPVRRRQWHQAVSGALFRRVMNGRFDAADEHIDRRLRKHDRAQAHAIVHHLREEAER